MSDRGVFAVARTIWGDEDFAPEPFTEREAWLWLISSAAWKEVRVRGARGPVQLKRSEFCFAVRFLAQRWQWSKSRVARFIDTLEKRDMIRDTSRDKSQVYSIKNYNNFQRVGLPKRDKDTDIERDDVGTNLGQPRDKEEVPKQVNPSLPSKEGARAHEAPFQLPEWVPLEPWAAFVDMRKQTRTPLTRKAMSLAVTKLEELRNAGQDPAAVLNQSAMRNWRGLFPVKREDFDGTRPGSKPAEGKQNRALGKFLAGDAREVCGDEGEGTESAGRPPALEHRPLRSAPAEGDNYEERPRAASHGDGRSLSAPEQHDGGGADIAVRSLFL